MRDDARRAVAYIAARLVSKRSASSIYDFDKNAYTFFSGEVGQSVAVFDHTSAVHISGSAQQVFHYGTNGFISLQINGKSFSGFDFSSSTHFNGSISQSNITVFDFGESKHFQYLLG